MIVLLLTVACVASTMAMAEIGLIAGLSPTAPSCRFEGNRFFSEKQLRDFAVEELSDFERLGRHKAEADDAAFQMESAYKKAGFYFAEVDYFFVDEEKGVSLLFKISEGPRVKVRDIFFRGNEFFAADALRSLFGKEMSSKLTGSDLYFTEEIGRIMVDAIRNAYLGEGFTAVRISVSPPVFSTDEQSVSLEIDIHEGIRRIIERVEFVGDIPDGALPQLQGLADSLQGEPFYNRRKQVLLLRVQEIYGNLGYPYAEVRIEERFAEQGEDVVLVVSITGGGLVTVDSVVLSGNRKTKSAFILNRLGLRPGDLFTLEQKRTAFKSLYQTGLFDRIDIELQQDLETVHHTVGVSVEESKSQELFVEAGWGSYELFRLGLGGRDKNFMGTGRIIRMEGKYSLMGETAMVGFSDPWFLGSTLVADLPLTYTRREEPSFTRQEIGSALFFSKSYTPTVTATLGYSYQLSRILDVQEALFAETLDTRYSVAALKAQVTLDTRNDIFYPSAGFRYSAGLDFSDELFGSDIGLVRLTAGGRHFWSLSENMVLGVRYQTGMVLPGRNQITIPLGERFYNGGENKVRSFRESRLGPVGLDRQPIGGMAFNLASIELRRRWTNNFSASVFGDIGNLSPNRSRSEEGEAAFRDKSNLVDTTMREYFRDFRSAVGIGGQYLLPVGPVRLDIALNPDYRQGRGEDRYVIHFSVGMAF